MLSDEHRRLKRSWLCLCTLLLALALACFKASANTVTFDFDTEFSSGTPPVGPTPWLVAVFQDVTPGTVTLTLSAPNLTGSEFVSGWYFNLGQGANSDLDPTRLAFAAPTSPNYTLPTVQTGENAFKADGDGKYDILLDFANSGGASREFTAGDSLTFTITGTGVDAGITAASFEYLSLHSGDHGPFYAAAHVQGIGLNGGSSGWVEPSGGPMTGGGDLPPTPDGGSTVLLLGSSLLGLAFLRGRISRK